MISMIRNWVARRVVYNRTYRELWSMTDRELCDLGLSRDMISDLAFESAYGRTRNG